MTFGIHKISSQRTCTLNIYIFEPTMTKSLYNTYNNKKSSVVEIHKNIRRHRPNMIKYHLYLLVRMMFDR